MRSFLKLSLMTVAFLGFFALVTTNVYAADSCTSGTVQFRVNPNDGCGTQERQCCPGNIFSEWDEACKGCPEGYMLEDGTNKCFKMDTRVVEDWSTIAAGIYSADGSLDVFFTRHEGEICPRPENYQCRGNDEMSCYTFREKEVADYGREVRFYPGSSTDWSKIDTCDGNYSSKYEPEPGMCKPCLDFFYYGYYYSRGVLCYDEAKIACVKSYL